MTARRANAVGMQPEITIVTPEREPLVFFGREASAALASTLAAAGVRLIAGVAARVERRPRLHLVTGPDETVAVDRVVAMPVLHGPAVRGVPHDELGFIVTDTDGRAEGCQRTWAADDGVASPLKLGGLATHQARRAARAIASYAGVETTPTDDDGELVLDGVLMTGAAPVALDDRPLEPASDVPLWWPSRKVAGRYLHAYLQGKERPAAQPRPQAGVRVRLDAATARERDTGYLSRPPDLPSADEIARLGRRYPRLQATPRPPSAHRFASSGRRQLSRAAICRFAGVGFAGIRSDVGSGERPSVLEKERQISSECGEQRTAEADADCRRDVARPRAASCVAMPHWG